MRGRWLVAFSFLVLAVHEAHELAHAVVARIVCGDWPVRDFNAWHFVRECASWWPTAAGPLFSYVLMFAGSVLARRSAAFRYAGAAVIFAANPFARVFTAAMGGGDEMVVAQTLLGAAHRTWPLRLAVLLIVLVPCGAAIAAGWRALRPLAKRWIWFFVLLWWPMVLTGIVLFAIGNRLLKSGVLAAPLVAGAPLLVIVVSAASAVAAVLTFGWLRTLPVRESAAVQR